MSVHGSSRVGSEHRAHFYLSSQDVASGDRKPVDSMMQVLAPRGPFVNIRIAGMA